MAKNMKAGGEGGVLRYKNIPGFV